MTARRGGGFPQGGAWRPQITLIMRGGPQAGHHFFAEKDNVIIGRVAGNDVVINDPQVSRRHASISWDGSRWIIKDLGSTNGTFVNGVRVTGTQVLREGDVVGLGDVLLTFQSAAMPASDITMAGMQRPPVPPPPGRAPVRPPAPAAGGGTSWVTMTGLGVAAILVIALLAVAALWLLSQKTPSGAPTVVINSPPNGTQVQVGDEVSIQSTATDAKGITRIELWADGNLYRTDSSPNPQGQPSFTVVQKWPATVKGSHTLMVKAYNAEGGASAPVSIVVNVGEVGATVTGAPPAATSTPTPTPTPTATQPGTPLPPGVPTATPSSTPLPTATTRACNDDAIFVTDLTVPDGTEFGPAQRIDKAWRLRNTGSCTWGSGYKLAFIAGDRMRAPDSVSVPNTAPGNTADIGVLLYAPSAPGTYTGYWRMQNPSGALFGQQVSVKIRVPSPATPTHTPSPTPSPSPTSPAQISFRVDRSSINAGECVTMFWDVENVREVYVDGSPQAGHGSQGLCPCSTETHTLRVVRTDGVEETRTVTINVSGVCPPSGPPDTPTQLSPADGSVFDHYPRTATFQWSAVSYPGGVTYGIEIQWGTPSGTDWQNYKTVTGLTSPTYDMDNFIGALNKGRWRVWAHSDTGGDSAKSGWWYFHFTQ